MKQKQKLDQVVVRAVASFARNLAIDAAGARSAWVIHQPKEPKDLAKRLQEMSKT